MARHIGFTGTSHGMTDKQAHWVELILDTIRPQVFHHGDCVGADDQAAGIAYRLGIELVAHPPENTKSQAWCTERYHHSVVHLPKPYLARNRDIVEASSILIATPREMEEQVRGGTWSTWRYARRLCLICYLVLPDGKVEVSNS